MKNPNDSDETVDLSPRHAEIRMIERDRRKQEVRDLRVACRMLYIIGATEDEVDDILTDRPTPSNPDEDWARLELARHWRLRGGMKG